ncbi:hypothetical protein T4D_8779 [Trichinella pseudospiralis]|uniref:Uncharacterized protein n=1 Tax=Trichinella pseudospiralis TaxID=6337 RepID=A0A0V1FSK0_TRIPS|nr:hypothetical protein T4D_8779 [Trichinella pseudospiralis]
MKRYNVAFSTEILIKDSMNFHIYLKNSQESVFFSLVANINEFIHILKNIFSLVDVSAHMAKQACASIRIEQKKNKNAHDTLQTMDKMTQIKREQSVSISNEENKTFEQGRHKAERRWYKVEERKIAGACG